MIKYTERTIYRNIREQLIYNYTVNNIVNNNI